MCACEQGMTAFDAFADFRMDGHVAIANGGAHDISEGIARTFSGAGGKATAATIAAETGNPVSGVGCDVTVPADIDA